MAVKEGLMAIMKASPDLILRIPIKPAMHSNLKAASRGGLNRPVVNCQTT